jgi:hypothetical protein
MPLQTSLSSWPYKNKLKQQQYKYKQRRNAILLRNEQELNLNLFYIGNPTQRTQPYSKTEPHRPLRHYTHK